MSSLDIRARATALKLLTKFGKACTLSRVQAGAYDPATGSLTNTVISQTGQAVMLEYGFRGSGLSNVPDSLIQQGDRKLLLSPVGITAPQINDTVEFSGATWRIMDIKETSPAGVAILYECTLRK